MTAVNRNVEMIRVEQFRIIKGSIPRQVRTALNAAVKAGLLGHLKKDGLKPEMYYHPEFAEIATAARDKSALDAIDILRRVMAPSEDEV